MCFVIAHPFITTINITLRKVLAEIINSFLISPLRVANSSKEMSTAISLLSVEKCVGNVFVCTAHHEAPELMGGLVMLQQTQGSMYKRQEICIEWKYPSKNVRILMHFQQQFH